MGNRTVFDIHGVDYYPDITPDELPELYIRDTISCSLILEVLMSAVSMNFCAVTENLSSEVSHHGISGNIGNY